MSKVKKFGLVTSLTIQFTMLHQNVAANFNAPIESPMFTDVDVVDLRYHFRKLHNGRGEVVDIRLPHDSSRYPQVRLPRMKAPFGIQDAMSAKPNSAKNFELEIADEELIRFFQRWDERNLEFLTINSARYLGKTMNEDTVRGKFNSLILPSKNTDYYSRCRVKVNEKTCIWVEQVDGSFVRGGVCDVRAQRDFMVTVAPLVYKVGGGCGLSLQCTEIRVLQ